MFETEHTYRGILFLSPSITRPEELAELIAEGHIEPSGKGGVGPFQFVRPRDRVVVDRAFAVADGGLDVLHCYYWSYQQCGRTPFLPECRRRIAGTEAYRYNMYLLRAHLPRTKVLAIALPFRRVAREAFALLAAQGRGRGFRYLSVDLERLVDAIARGRNRPTGGKARVGIKMVRLRIDGDGQVDSLDLRGQAVPGSDTMNAVRRAVQEHGLAASPELVRLSLNLAGGLVVPAAAGTSLWIEVEGGHYRGHYAFWVGVDAANMALLHEAIMYFRGEDLLAETTTSPKLYPPTGDEGYPQDD